MGKAVLMPKFSLSGLLPCVSNGLTCMESSYVLSDNTLHHVSTNYVGNAACAFAAVGMPPPSPVILWFCAHSGAMFTLRLRLAGARNGTIQVSNLITNVIMGEYIVYSHPVRALLWYTHRCSCPSLPISL